MRLVLGRRQRGRRHDAGHDRDDASGGDATTEIPDETAGPFPGDGSNGPNVLAESGVVRSDITKSIGDLSGTAGGVPTTIEMTLLDVAGGGTPLAGAAVYVWHCDREGRYSMYDVADQNYLRGVQETGSDGKVTFKSIFPAAYSGRWPHIHFEVYESVAAATGSGAKLKTSQIALPEDDLPGRLRHEGLRAERAEPRPDLARHRHGLQRRLRQRAREDLGRRRQRDHGEAQRRR